jgi:hypothetical protein
MLWQTYAELGAADLVMPLYRLHRKANREVPNVPGRTGTLIAYALFEIALGQMDAAANTLADCIPDAPSWECMLDITKCRLAVARCDSIEGMTLADTAVEISRQYKLERFLPEALYLKGKLHFMRGDLIKAKNVLEQARSAAEKLGSRRLLWQIIAILAEVESDKDLSMGLKAEAQEIIQYIANHITRQDLRASFLRFAAISAVVT